MTGGYDLCPPGPAVGEMLRAPRTWAVACLTAPALPQIRGFHYSSTLPEPLRLKKRCQRVHCESMQRRLRKRH